MNYKKILVTDATGVVGAAINAVKDGYPRSRFILISSQDCDLMNTYETLNYMQECSPDAIN